MENKSLDELSSLVKDIHVKTREASQNTNLDMWEFFEIDKALQSIQGKLLKNTSKLTEINKLIKMDTKKLEEVENDLTHTDEQRQRQIRQFEYWKTDKARNTITEAKRSLNTSCKDQENPWKSSW